MFLRFEKTTITATKVACERKNLSKYWKIEEATSLFPRKLNVVQRAGKKLSAMKRSGAEYLNISANTIFLFPTLR
jgi:hypothetical protein